MSLTVGEVAAMITIGSTAGSVLFFGVLHLGRITGRLERTENKVGDLEHRMDRAGEKMSDLANEVQTIPTRFLSREEALLWRGSRAEDRP